MLSKTTRVRRVATLCGIAVVAVIGLAAAPVHAHTETTTTAPGGAVTTAPRDAVTTTTAAPQIKPNEMFNGVTVGPGTVTTPGSPSRTLNANQTAAFMRTWLPASVFSNLPNEKPDECLTQSTLRFENTFSGIKTPTTVYYVSDGTNAWVGMPAQDLGFASVPEEKWIAAPDAKVTIDAFNAPGDPPSTTNKCATNNPAPAEPTKAAADDSSDSPTWLFIAVPVAIVVAAGIWLLLRSRSRAGVA